MLISFQWEIYPSFDRTRTLSGLFIVSSRIIFPDSSDLPIDNWERLGVLIVSAMLASTLVDDSFCSLHMTTNLPLVI